MSRSDRDSGRISILGSVPIVGGSWYWAPLVFVGALAGAVRGGETEEDSISGRRGGSFCGVGGGIARSLALHPNTPRVRHRSGASLQNGQVDYPEQRWSASGRLVTPPGVHPGHHFAARPYRPLHPRTADVDSDDALDGRGVRLPQHRRLPHSRSGHVSRWRPPARTPPTAGCSTRRRRPTRRPEAAVSASTDVVSQAFQSYLQSWPPTYNGLKGSQGNVMSTGTGPTPWSTRDVRRPMVRTPTRSRDSHRGRLDAPDCTSITSGLGPRSPTTTKPAR